MQKYHVALFVFPHHAHINPIFPIVRTLIRRGHRVTYAIAKIAFSNADRFAQRLSEVGAEGIAGSRFNSPEKPPLDPAAGQLDCRYATEILAQCERFYENNRPDLIIYDFRALAGRILAHRWGVPAVQTSPTSLNNRAAFTADDSSSGFFQRVLEWGRRNNDFVGRHGVVSASDSAFPHEGLNVYFFPKSLQPNAGLVGEDCFYAGRLAGEQLYFGDWQRTDDGERPIVLIANSTTYFRDANFFKMCMDALSGLSWHVVLSIGEFMDAKVLGTLPPHVEIAQNTSHVQILRYASLVIGLGGIISVSEAAYHGVPTIAVSCGVPENEWEQRHFEHLGTVIHLSQSEMSAENLRHAVIRASADTALQQRVKAFQHTVRREPGAEETVNRIEDYLESCLQRHAKP